MIGDYRTVRPEPIKFALEAAEGMRCLLADEKVTNESAKRCEKLLDEYLDCVTSWDWWEAEKRRAELRQFCLDKITLVTIYGTTTLSEFIRHGLPCHCSCTCGSRW